MDLGWTRATAVALANADEMLQQGRSGVPSGLCAERRGEAESQAVRQECAAGHVQVGGEGWRWHLIDGQLLANILCFSVSRALDMAISEYTYNDCKTLARAKDLCLPRYLSTAEVEKLRQLIG